MTGGGGGRYDELVRLMGTDQDVPAIGFAYNVSQIISDMSNSTRQNDPGVIALVVAPSAFASAIAWQKTLQKVGYPTVILDTDTRDYPITLRINEQSLQFNNHTYQIDQIDALVREIEANA